ncbi:g9339 [Coccomyxa elongata]
MASFVCETCGLELSSKHALESHVNRKYKCVPPGQIQYECRTCDKQFTRKNLLDQHLRTDKHSQAVAAAEAAEGTGPTSLVASESPELDKSSLNIDSHDTTNNSTGVRIRPRSFGRANVDHMICLTYEELREALDLREKCGLTPFLKLFKVLHLNPEAPRNHNALVDVADGEPVAFAFKQSHWHEVDCDEMVRDCVNNAAIRLLDIEFILAPRMPVKGFSKLMKLRDTVERETNGLFKDPSIEVQALMRRTSSAIAAFTEANPDLLAHARADAHSAPSLVRPMKTRDLPEWEPEVGHRWLALARMQQTGEYPIPPSV